MENPFMQAAGFVIDHLASGAVSGFMIGAYLVGNKMYKKKQQKKAFENRRPSKKNFNC